MSETVRVERREGVVRLVLNRPAVANALDETLANELSTGLSAAEADPQVRVLTLTGSERFFCAGGDIRSMAASGPAERQEHLLDLATATSDLVTALSRTRLLVVAGVQGTVAGAGMGLVLAADWVLASDAVRFVAAFPAVGLTPDTGVSYLLPRAVGPQRAVELALGGRRLDAVEAEQWGLTSRTVPAGDFDRHLTEAEDRFLASPPHVVTPTLELLRAGRFGPDWQDHLRTEAHRVSAAAAHPESQRLMDDFLGAPARGA